MANVTEPYPKADTLANCGGAVSMGQIGNDVSFFTNYMYIYIYFFSISFVWNSGWKCRLSRRMRLSLFARFFCFPFPFFSLSNRERERIDRLFGLVLVFLVSRNYDCSVHMYRAHKHHLAYICHSRFLHAYDRRIPKVIEILHTIHLAEIQCNNEREKWSIEMIESSLINCNFSILLNDSYVSI